MMERLTNLLKIRKKTKTRKPSFRRQDSHKKKKLGMMWRKARGLHSNVRLNVRGFVKGPSHGYGSPRAVKFRNRFGYREVIVQNLSDLVGLDKDAVQIKIARTVGKRKKVQLIEKAKTLGLTISNVKDADSFAQRVKDEIKQRKEKKSARSKKRKEKNETKEKEKSDSLDKKVSDKKTDDKSEQSDGSTQEKASESEEPKESVKEQPSTKKTTDTTSNNKTGKDQK